MAGYELSMKSCNLETKLSDSTKAQKVSLRKMRSDVINNINDMEIGGADDETKLKYRDVLVKSYNDFDKKLLSKFESYHKKKISTQVEPIPMDYEESDKLKMDAAYKIQVKAASTQYQDAIKDFDNKFPDISIPLVETATSNAKTGPKKKRKKNSTSHERIVLAPIPSNQPSSSSSRKAKRDRNSLELGVK